MQNIATKTTEDKFPGQDNEPTGPQIALDFIKLLFEHAAVRPFLNSLGNEKDGTQDPKDERPRNDDDTLDFVKTWDRPERGMFFCVSTIKGQRRNKENAAELPMLFADIDLKDVDESIESIERKLKTQLPLPPSIMVRSGNGLHAYWLFKEPISIHGNDEMKDRIEGALRILADLVAGDLQVCEVARLMRLPGTHNTKRSEWTPVVITHQTDHRYELDDLEEWLGEQSPIILRKSREVGVTVGQSSERDYYAEYGALAPKAQIDVKSRLDAMMFMGHGDASIHATQLSVTAAMLNKGYDTGDVVELVLAATKAAAGDFGKRWNWRVEELNIRGMCESWLNKQALADKIPKPLSRVNTGANAIVSAAQVIDNGTLTQDGMARIFAQRYDGRLRFCHHAGAWYVWTGSHWQKDEKAVAFQFVRELGREFTDAPTALKTEVKEVRRVTFAGGVERFAQSDPAFAVTSDDWDQDPYLLGTPGGTVDLRTGKLREPDPADGITKTTLIAPSDKADCPLWMKFLRETFGDDPEMIRFVQQWAGYCLTGDTREQALFFGTGDGGNGKGVWLHTRMNIMKDYAVAAAMQTFVASSQERHSTELAMLRGARMVTASETEKGRAWAEARIKQLTGGDPITARFMRQDDFTFLPQFKLDIIGNHKPQLRNVDAAARRRFNIVPFDRKPAVVDRELEAKLMGEAPAILRWMIDGCLDWQQNGLKRPQSVVDATESYFSDQDSFSQWIDECCESDPGNPHKNSTAKELYGSWSEYAQAAGESPGSQKEFADTLLMSGRGIIAKRKTKGVVYLGIRLLPPSESRHETEADRASDWPDSGTGERPRF
jgi:putative DNA primase/helicase